MQISGTRLPAAVGLLPASLLPMVLSVVEDIRGASCSLLLLPASSVVAANSVVDIVGIVVVVGFGLTLLGCGLVIRSA